MCRFYAWKLMRGVVASLLVAFQIRTTDAVAIGGETGTIAADASVIRNLRSAGTADVVGGDTSVSLVGGDASVSVDATGIVRKVNFEKSRQELDYDKVIAWSLCNTEVHNNLGGLGPQGDDPSLRFSRIAKIDGKTDVDLLIVSQGEYKNNAPETNGLHGCLGGIHMDIRAPSEAVFRFKFVTSGTSKPIEDRYFFVSFMDIDSGPSGLETFVINTGVVELWQPKPSALTRVQNNKYIFKASQPDHPSPNCGATYPELADGAKAASIGAVMESTFTVRFKIDPARPKGGRSFFFGGNSNCVPSNVREEEKKHKAAEEEKRHKVEEEERRQKAAAEEERKKKVEERGAKADIERSNKMLEEWKRKDEEEKKHKADNERAEKAAAEKRKKVADEKHKKVEEEKERKYREEKE